jgi:hypothetical protein
MFLPSFQVSVLMNIISYNGVMLIQDELLLVSSRHQTYRHLCVLDKCVVIYIA